MEETDAKNRLMQTVQAVLKLMYRNAKPILYAKDHAVHFGIIISGAYRTSVSFDLFEKEAIVRDQPAGYGLDVFFAFSDSRGNELNLADTDENGRRKLIEGLQSGIKWSTVLAETGTGGTVEIGLYRAINTSFEDLKKAKDGKLGSELVTALHEISREYERLCPILISYSRGEIRSLRNIAELTNPPIRTRLL